MEAATRQLSGEKAQRIVDAMRVSVGKRGAAGSTFDHVAREAGVSRGLLHYYFGTKERLLVEVVRRDCDVRMELLDLAFAQARTADDLVAAMVSSLRDMVDQDPGFMSIVFELFTGSRQNEELGTEVAELMRRTRSDLAERLQRKVDDGSIRLAADADAVAGALFALADGLALRMLAEPAHDHGPVLDAATRAVRCLVLDA